MGTNKKQSTENFITDIRRKTRRLFSSEYEIQLGVIRWLELKPISELTRPEIKNEQKNVE